MIPKRIIQTFPTEQVDARFLPTIQMLRERNPTWDYELHTDEMVLDFIEKQLDSRLVRAFKSIHSDYSVAKADFWRYLYCYEHGGAYFDIKSTSLKKLDLLIKPTDEYLLSHWHLGAWGWHPDLSNPKGEYQQWHILARAKHPYLQAVIERMLMQLDRYDPNEMGVGRNGVFVTTGPVTYSTAIEEIIDQHPHRLIHGYAEGLRYTMLADAAHRSAFKTTHYSVLRTPIVAA